MPCFVDGPFTDEEQGWPRQKAAALCAVLSALERGNAFEFVLNSVDWDEAGVSRGWLEAWWADHKHEDEERRERDREKQRDHEIRTAALAKLSPAERSVLGIDA